MDILNFVYVYSGAKKLRQIRADSLRERVDQHLLLDNHGQCKSKQEIVVYFGSESEDYYQLKQWLSVFQKLGETKKITYLFRKKSSYRLFKRDSQDKAEYLPYLNNLENYFEINRPQIVLYVNNNVNNFQSLIYSSGHHIHLNHGESDKVCMESNQVKAYDYAFVCGSKAIQRYSQRIQGVDLKKLIQIGRPQVDVVPEANLSSRDNRKLIVYAPTWEGDREVMAYSSVERLGVKIISNLIKSGQYDVCYKPHPKLGTRDPRVKREHRKIVTLVEESSNAYIYEGDVIGLLKKADVLISDVSSVVIDFLITGKPYWIYLPSHMPDVEQLDSVKAGYTYDEHWENIEHDVQKGLVLDEKKNFREKIRKDYYAFNETGDSIRRFEEVISNLINKNLL